MRVSVIIPTFNRAKVVAEAIESVLAQTRRADEIIVVDDGSTDGTAENLERFRGQIQYVPQQNGGVSVARNTGMRHSRGDLIAFLDADDVWHPRKLERQLAIFERRPDIGLLATPLICWPGTFVAASQLACGAVKELTLEDMLLANPIATSSIVVRRDVIGHAGEFDPELLAAEDYDLWLRCVQVSPVAILLEPLTGYRESSGSLGKHAEKMHDGLLRIRAKLDAAGVLQGRPWFRRKCQAHSDYTNGWLFYTAGQHDKALRLLVKSLLNYPLPMWPPEVYCHAARLRLLWRTARSYASSYFAPPAARSPLPAPSATSNG